MSKLGDIYDGLIKRIRMGETLPLQGTEWWLDDGLGWTVAHEAAKLGRIPAGFSRGQWAEVDDFMNPVANIAAKFGTLPEDFEFWDIRDDIGNTPGHVAAINGKTDALPASFNAWDAANHDGKTVKDLVAEREARMAESEKAKPKMGL